MGLLSLKFCFFFSFFQDLMSKSDNIRKYVDDKELSERFRGILKDSIQKQSTEIPVGMDVDDRNSIAAASVIALVLLFAMIRKCLKMRRELREAHKSPAKENYGKHTNLSADRSTTAAGHGRAAGLLDVD